MLVRQRRRTFGHDDDVRGGGDHEDNVDVDDLLPFSLWCTWHSTLSSKESEKCATLFFLQQKKVLYVCSTSNFLDMVGGDYWEIGFTKVLEEKEEERDPNYGVDYCHQLENDYYHNLYIIE